MTKNTDNIYVATVCYDYEGEDILFATVYLDKAEKLFEELPFRGDRLYLYRLKDGDENETRIINKR